MQTVNIDQHIHKCGHTVLLPVSCCCCGY